jgi:precorrin-2 dehydrogenase/sirohydrochlorin ferrochelatase
MLSMILTLRETSVLVVGGGTVGRRKAALVASAGGVVTVVDPRAVASALPVGVSHTAEPFADAHLAGARLAFACATPEVNAAVVAAAKARGVWVCSASDPASGDFVLPCVVRRGDLTFAVSTGGASPALARRIAADVLERYDDAYAEWVRVLGRVRCAVLTKVPDPAARRRLLEHFVDPIWLERIRAVGADVTLAEMLGRVSAGSPGGGV